MIIYTNSSQWILPPFSAKPITLKLRSPVQEQRVRQQLAQQVQAAQAQAAQAAAAQQAWDIFFGEGHIWEMLKDHGIMVIYIYINVYIYTYIVVINGLFYGYLWLLIVKINCYIYMVINGY